MHTNSHTTNRLDYLDAVRAFALLLGIVFHASLSFMPIFIGWAVMDISTSSIVAIFAHISHSFRMELFFLIAGFFSRMSLHKKGSGNFLQTRFYRIVIPFLIGWLILRPLLIAGWIIGGESMRGVVNVLSAFANSMDMLRNTPATQFFIGSHLWFLYYLTLFSVGVLLIRGLIGVNQGLYNRVSNLADQILTWLTYSRFGILALAPLTAICLWFMERWGVDTPDKSLLPHLPVSILYAGFFLFGWGLNRNVDAINTFCQLTWGKVILCLVSICLSAILNRYSSETGSAHYSYLKASFVLSYAAMMWTLVAITIGVFKHFTNRPSQKIRYIADASYWLYLIHLPIVIFLQIIFAELALHWSIKLVSISLITAVISLLIYDLFVRSTAIGALLNGSKKERLIFQLKKANTHRNDDNLSFTT